MNFIPATQSSFLSLLQSIPVGFQVVLALLVIMYLLHFFDFLLFKKRIAANYSIRPRAKTRILAIVLAHYLHANRQHIFANTIPYFILGSVIALSSLEEFMVASLAVMLVGSTCTFMFGSDGAHLGASGLITGFFGFILTRGFFTQNAEAVLLGFVVLAFYFGIFRIIFGHRKGVSNVLHFWGFVGGIVGAWLWSVIRVQVGV
jgi:membrane associated rhomboid family serine protease